MTIVFAVFLKNSVFLSLFTKVDNTIFCVLMFRRKCFKDDPIKTGSGPGRSLALSVCRQPPQTAGKHTECCSCEVDAVRACVCVLI